MYYEKTLMVEELPNRMVIGLPPRSKIWGGILLLAAVAASLLANQVGVIGIVIALLSGGWGLWLITRCRSVVFDAARQEATFAGNRFLFGRKRESVAFDTIVEVYLDYAEETHTDSEGSGWGERKWKIFLGLQGGRTVTVASTATRHVIEDASSLKEQAHYWDALAARVSALIGKPLVRTPAVPGGPHTFVEAIDQVLQNRLKETPFSNRSVHLRSSNNGGLEIVVDGRVYGELDEIEDTAIHDLIRSSVDEWQNSDPRGTESATAKAMT